MLGITQKPVDICVTMWEYVVIATTERSFFMTEPKHTPTPWKSDDIGQIHAFERGLVAKVLERDTDADQYFVEKANAAFIVRACNAHDELVAAIKLARAEIGVFDPLFHEGIARIDRILHQALATIEQGGK